MGLKERETYETLPSLFFSPRRVISSTSMLTSLSTSNMFAGVLLAVAATGEFAVWVFGAGCLLSEGIEALGRKPQLGFLNGNDPSVAMGESS